MANLFNSVKGLKPKRNAFSAISYRNDYTCNLGQCVPIYIQHVVPNTNIMVSTHALIRLQALIAPIMDNIDYYVHFWQIPYRLLEGNFTKFVGGELEDDSEYNPPYITKTIVTNLDEVLQVRDPTLSSSERTAIINKIIGNGSLLDMLGIDKTFFTQTGGTTGIKLNIRNIQAYFFLMYHWYVNEHVMPSSNFEALVKALLSSANVGNANGTVANILVDLYLSMGLFFNHGWQFDYFTKALPNVQEGEPVTLPLGGEAPVSLNASYIKIGNETDAPGNYVHVNAETGGLLTNVEEVTVTTYQGAGEGTFGTLAGANSGVNIPSISGPVNITADAVADLSEATAITVNELRVGNALQVFKERIMRFGHRAPEYYKGFFNVTPEDLRLQLPKYLGGGRIPINISDVEQTSSTNSTSPQGNLAGKGTAIAGGFAGFKTFCSEESVIIGIAWLQPKITYSNSLSRMLLKLNDRYDYFNPSFEHLGEQAIHNIEVWAAGNMSDFGYTPRFAEYRFHQNEQHGEFKGSLNHWTLGRIFTTQPTLSPEFIYMQPSVLQRIFAVVEDPTTHLPVPNVLASVKFSAKMVAPISKYGTPMLLA